MVYTYRCAKCAYNWPYRQRFTECPVCEKPCSVTMFHTAAGVLTIDEANEILRDHGLELVPKPSHVAPKRPPGARDPTAAEIDFARQELDSWATMAPLWLR